MPAAELGESRGDAHGRRGALPMPWIHLPCSARRPRGVSSRTSGTRSGRKHAAADYRRAGAIWPMRGSPRKRLRRQAERALKAADEGRHCGRERLRETRGGGWSNSSAGARGRSAVGLLSLRTTRSPPRARSANSFGPSPLGARIPIRRSFERRMRGDDDAISGHSHRRRGPVPLRGCRAERGSLAITVDRRAKLTFRPRGNRRK